MSILRKIGRSLDYLTLGNFLADENKFVEHTYMALGYDLAKKAETHLKNSPYLQKKLNFKLYRYNTPSVDMPLYLSIDEDRLKQDDKDLDLKIEARNLHARERIDLFKLSKKILGKEWEKYLPKLKEAYDKKGFDYMVSLVEKKTEKRLYKILDDNLYNLSKEIYALKKPLSKEERELAEKKLKKKKEQEESESSYWTPNFPIPFSCLIIILSLMAILGSFITGNAIVFSFPSYVAIATLLLIKRNLSKPKDKYINKIDNFWENEFIAKLS